MPYSRQDFVYRLRVSDRLAIRHFRKALPGNSFKEFDESFSAVIHAERPFCDHPSTQSLTIFAACALSLYRVLLASGCDAHAAKAQVARPVLSFGKRTSALIMWLMRITSRNPFESVRQYSRESTPRQYGPSFAISYEQLGDSGDFASVVYRCGFAQILERHGALELLELFCQWDRVWIEALPSGIRFTRPQTIAQGSDTCRFEFRRH